MRVELTEKALLKIAIPKGKRSATFSFNGFPNLQLITRYSSASFDPINQPDSVKQLNTTYDFRYRYFKPGTKSRTLVSLGNYPDKSLSDIQAQYNQCVEQLKNGIDPQISKLENKIRAINEQALIDGVSSPSSINSVWTSLKNDWPLYGKSQRTLQNYTRTFSKVIFPQFNGRNIKGITAQEWDEFILHLSNVQNKKGLAFDAHKAMRRLFSYAVEKGIIQYNPLLGRKTVLDNTRLNAVTDHLNSSQLHKFLNEVDSLQVKAPVIFAAKIMLFCGVRSEEWTRVKIGWINFDSMRIEHPAAAMKNRYRAWTHLPEPVMKMLLEYLNGLKAKYGKLDPEMFLLHDSDPFKQLGSGRLSKWFSAFHDWIYITPRMMRKTISTHLQERNAPIAARKAIRNQVIVEGVDKHYEFNDLYSLKKEWLERWQKILEEVKSDPSALENKVESHLNKEMAEQAASLFS